MIVIDLHQNVPDISQLTLQIIQFFSDLCSLVNHRSRLASDGLHERRNALNESDEVDECG
jgi:hypothetical protein